MDQPLNSDDEPALSPEELDELYAAAANKWVQEVRESIAEARRDTAAQGISGPHLISVDELRAAGALDVPAAWRKSLGGDDAGQRDLFSGLLDDHDSPTEDDDDAASD